MRERILMVGLLLTVGCTGGGAKQAPDEPLVNEGAADSLRSPSLRGPIDRGSDLGGDFSKGRFPAYTLTLAAGQVTNLRLGGVATDGSILDTVLYVYGPADAKGKRVRVGLSDDRTSDDLGSALTVTAAATGDYLVVASTFWASDRGNYHLNVGCPDGRCSDPLPADGPQPQHHFGFPTFANPELLAYFDLHLADGADATAKWPDGHVDAMIDLLASDTREDGATGAVSGSDVAFVNQTIFAAGDALTQAQIKKLNAAIDTWLGTPTQFAQRRSPVAQFMAMISIEWETPSTPAPASAAKVYKQLQASWPGSTLNSPETSARGRNGKTYGFMGSLTLTNGKQAWDGVEIFLADGTWLGDFSFAPHEAGVN